MTEIESPPPDPASALVKTNLFQLGKFTSHSGQELDWKIECDALTSDDWDCLALIAIKMMMSHTFPGANFPSEIIPIPNGGIKFAEAIQKQVNWSYNKPTFRLFVDDVLTSGSSFRKVMTKKTDMGLVLFARGPLIAGVQAVFKMPFGGL